MKKKRRIDSLSITVNNTFSVNPFRFKLSVLSSENKTSERNNHIATHRDGQFWRQNLYNQDSMDGLSFLLYDSIINLCTQY